MPEKNHHKKNRAGRAMLGVLGGVTDRVANERDDYAT
jgi:hypothetical protein